MATKKENPAPQAPQATGGAIVKSGSAGGGLLANVPRVEILPYQFVEMVKGSGGDVMAALKENLGGTQLSAWDFQRVKVPAGGGLAWTVMDAETGELKPATEIRGVIVAWNDQKAYWSKGLDEQGGSPQPPQCFSLDTVHGIGDPGGPCGKCPFNQFGTAKGGKGRGKACKDTRILFFMREGDVMPMVLPVPPTSLKPVKDYFLRLATRAVPYWGCETVLKLKTAENAQKIAYAQVAPSVASVFGGEALGAARAYTQVMRGILGKATIQVTSADMAADEATERNAAEQAAAEGEEVDRSAEV